MEPIKGDIWEPEFLKRLALVWWSGAHIPLKAEIRHAREWDDVTVWAPYDVSCRVWRNCSGERAVTFVAPPHDNRATMLSIAPDGLIEHEYGVAEWQRKQWLWIAWALGFPVEASGHEKIEWRKEFESRLEFLDAFVLDVTERHLMEEEDVG
jgi:hypothetical protein